MAPLEPMIVRLFSTIDMIPRWGKNHFKRWSFAKPGTQLSGANADSFEPRPCDFELLNRVQNSKFKEEGRAPIPCTSGEVSLRSDYFKASGLHGMFPKRWVLVGTEGKYLVDSS
jgi:hypothetical protein